MNASRGNLSTLRRQLNALDTTIAESSAELKQVEKDLASLGGKSNNVSIVEETEWKNLSVFLEDIC